MNEETPSNSPAESDNCEVGKSCDKIKDSFTCATDYLRRNPWVGVAAGVVIGAAVFACTKCSKPEPTNLEKLRALLDDMYAKLPSKKEAKSAVDCLLNKLHIPV
jgi:hypothetical protein